MIYTICKKILIASIFKIYDLCGRFLIGNPSCGVCTHGSGSNSGSDEPYGPPVGNLGIFKIWMIYRKKFLASIFII